MWNLHVLFLVFVFISVKESNATYSAEAKQWTLGSAVNATFGPEDAVYCKLVDYYFRPVFDGFGQCRVVLDRVTMDHRGYWKIWFGTPGTVVVRSYPYLIDVVPAAGDTTPRVTGNVARRDSMVILTCAVPEVQEIMACTFSDPTGTIFIATRGVHQEGQNTTNKYESNIDHHGCTLALLTPRNEHPGIWRCSVNTTQVTSHGFIVVRNSMLQQNNMYDEKPVLRNTFLKDWGMAGDASTMFCSIEAPIRYCYFRAPNGTVYNVGPSTSSPGYEYAGRGFDAGECGITFDLSASDEGLWTCNVGLEGNYQELMDSFIFHVKHRLVANHSWSGSSLEVRLSIFDEPKLEYCRFVRSDGLGFDAEYAPHPYVSERGEDYGVCALTIQNPTDEDLRPWTIVAKIIGEDGEVFMTTTLDSRRRPRRGLSSPTAIVLWSLLGAVLVFLIGMSCFPKRNRKWAAQRAASIRNTFRKQPQPQQQNVTDLPKPEKI